MVEKSIEVIFVTPLSKRADEKPGGGDVSVFEIIMRIFRDNKGLSAWEYEGLRWSAKFQRTELGCEREILPEVPQPITSTLVLLSMIGRARVSERYSNGAYHSKRSPFLQGVESC